MLKPVQHDGRVPAFSLVEMLMALLVASLLLAALAPVLTKKARMENISVAGATGVGKVPAVFQCWDSSKDLQGLGQGVVDVVVPKGVWFVNFVLASGGGGGAGATVPQEKPNNAYSGGTPLTITPEMDEFVITSMTGGGGGAGGAAGKYSLATFNANATDCANISGTDTTGHSGNYATYDSANGLCVTKYNQVSNPDTYMTSFTINGYTDTRCIGNYTHGSNCNASQNQMSYAYSGCQRPVCTHAGAVAACQKLSEMTGIAWDLPTYAQIQKWGSVYKNLALCTYYGSSNAIRSEVAYCFTSTSTVFSGQYCQGCGTTTYVAQPYAVWAKEAYNTKLHYYGVLGSSWSYSYNNSGLPQSARCVVGSARTERFYSLSGGRGGYSPKISANFALQNTLNEKIKENVGGTINFEIGEGGEGGLGAVAKDQLAKETKGKDGTPSCILIKDKNGASKFKLCVPGGKGGYGADGRVSDAATAGWGKGGEGISATNGCYTIEYINGVAQTPEPFNCSASGNPGADGVSTTNSASTADGSAGSVSGEGGYGGVATKTDSTTGGEATLKFGKGGKGASGAIQMTYKLKYEAAGGGGGGGGYVAHITDINNPGSDDVTYRLVIGGGGGGGAAGAPGGKGGDTSIKPAAQNITYKVLGGEGGKIGTSAGAAGSADGKGGAGGDAGKYADEDQMNELAQKKSFKGYKGLEGKAGGDATIAPSNYKENVRSAGGRGGTSGSGFRGKCGALYNENYMGQVICSLVSADANNEIARPNLADLDAKGFTTQEFVIPTKEGIAQDNPNLGQAGAGGGGGAWYAGVGQGAGAAGMGGYACVYWDDPEG